MRQTVLSPRWRARHRNRPQERCRRLLRSPLRLHIPGPPATTIIRRSHEKDQTRFIAGIVGVRPRNHGEQTHGC